MSFNISVSCQECVRFEKKKILHTELCIRIILKTFLYCFCNQIKYISDNVVFSTFKVINLFFNMEYYSKAH